MGKHLYICYQCKKIYEVSDKERIDRCVDCGMNLTRTDISAYRWNSMSKDRQKEFLKETYEKQHNYERKERPVNTRKGMNPKGAAYYVLIIMALIALVVLLIAGGIGIYKFVNLKKSEEVIGKKDIEETEEKIEKAGETASKDIKDKSIETKELSPEEKLMTYLNDVIIPEYGFITDMAMSADYVWRSEPRAIDVGDFSGQAGVLGYKFVDLNKDGVNEMLVLKRLCEMVPDDYLYFSDRGTVAVWTTTFDVLYLNKGEVKQTEDNILTQLNGKEGIFENYRSGSFEVKILLKELDSGFEICCSDEYGSPLWADGISIDFNVYAFDGEEVKKVTECDFLGSDCFNEDGSFSKSASEAGMDATAEFWKDMDNWNGDVSALLVSPDEPDCEDLLYVKTESNFDLYDTFYYNLNASLDEYKLVANTTSFLSTENIDGAAKSKIFTTEKQEKEAEAVADKGVEQFKTVNGSTYVIPKGFVDRSPDFGTYEHNNAAGGYTYTYVNDSLGMTINIDEYIWANVYGFDADFKSALQGEYSFKKKYYSDVTKPEGNSFDVRYIEENGNNVYEKIIADDTFLHDITFEYPQSNKDECESIIKYFLEQFSIREFS